jgi:diguanylate cyclase (GGDEF)-like protein
LSFRLRLTLFFVLIVVLPMVALAVLVSEIAADSADGKVDARLDAGLRTATSLYEDAQTQSRREAKRIAAEIANDESASAALESGSAGEVEALADELTRRHDLASLRLTDAIGRSTGAGDGTSVAAASVNLVGAGGPQIGRVTASTVTSAEFLDTVEATTGEDTALIGPEGPLTGAVPIEAGALPESGEAAELEQGGESLRVAATEPLGTEQLRIALFARPEDEGFLASRPRIAIALAAFFAVALLAVLLTLRSLQGYVREMLGAARRIGEGDFSEKVPVSGRDEMAGLAGEFNRMSDRLSDQMSQLRRQRVEIENSVRRIGEAFASGLDRQALLAILVDTAIVSCDADYGLIALSGHVGSEAEAGTATEALRDVALAAEQGALRDGEPTEIEEDSAFALASSMGRIGPSETPVGAMTVARSGRPFNKGERDVFLYLVTQAAASVENVALHELVSEQAVTDDLTGLANKRAFREVMEKEAARAGRFEHDLSLMILDIDDFKPVNDTHGHLQGDEVLRTVGRILDAESRGIDEPARYGGEEFAIALPETSTEGALEVAERVRAAIARTPIHLVEGGGVIRATASIGVATLPGLAANAQDLIAAADGALYEAKRTGKNRVCVASEDRRAPVEGRWATAGAAKGPAPPRRT